MTSFFINKVHGSVGQCFDPGLCGGPNESVSSGNFVFPVLSASVAILYEWSDVTYMACLCVARQMIVA